MLNVHPSLLPRWRGAAPIERAIEAGDDETGVSIMRPVAEMDAGPVCLERRAPDPARRRLRLAVPAAGGARRRAARGGPRRAARVQEPSRSRASRSRPRSAPRTAASIRAAAPTSSSGACVLSARTSAPTSSCPTASGWACTGRARRSGSRRPRVSWWPTTGGFCSAPPTAPSSCSRSQPAGGRAMDAEAYLRGRGAKLGGGV